MLISEKSIEQVRDTSITEVIGHYIKLDRNGKACCPFHDERTPSFKVTEAKSLYKCFGCGVSGDGIRFVMEHDKLDFIDAIEKIAALCHITIDYEEVPDKEKYEKQKAFKDELKDVLTYTITRYRDNLLQLSPEHPVINYLNERNITKELIVEWQIGWSTEEWHHISGDIINNNKFEPAHRLGIIMRSKDNRNYDGYRSRITIPITNKHGEYIGLAGRFLEIDPNDKNKNFPKYINPPQNELYDKSSVLFGLSRADKFINKEGFAFLVEGYFDVISMHANRDSNTVGTCGTALTEQQAALLRKYSSHVAVLRDGDEAGRKAAMKDLVTLLRAGFKVDIVVLPEKEDPDSYTQKLIANHYRAGNVEMHDGVMLQVENYLRYVNNDEFKMGRAQEAILHLLLTIPNDLIRNNYFDSICLKYKWKRPALQKQLLAIQEQKQDQLDDDDEGASNLDKMPKWMDREEFMTHGYCVVNNKKRTGYYSMSGENWIEITNFTIKPLFHIYAGKESRHLIQIDNGRKKAVLDIESKALVSIDILQQYVVCEGPYIIYGSKPQMLRIATNLLGNFPRCIEVKFLGWQQPGFFAFVDKIYIPGQPLRDLDEWGIIKHDDQNYLVPAASAAYKELQQTGDDPYEMDRALCFRPGLITFPEWAHLVNRVYKEKGPVAIAYVFLSLFRDIVFDIDNNCPHLYGYGERSSGKSKWADSICAVFYKKRSAFNLNSGTDFAFFAYMQRFPNCPAQMNEFDEKTMKPEWFQVTKGVFDGEGRQRGVMGSKNRTEIMKVRSTIILIGQFLVTIDDNSIVSRSIIEGFNERELTDQDKKEFDRLKQFEEAGLSHLMIFMLEHRAYIKERYRDKFNEILSKWRHEIDGEFNIRIMQNWCHLFTCWQLMADKFQLPVSAEQFEKYCRQRALHWSGFIRSSDTLSEFWNTLAFLVDQGVLIDGWDFKIKKETSVKLRRKKDNNQEDEEYTIDFAEPTKIIYIRMNNVHKHYQQAFKNRTGKEGMSLDNLNHYFSGRKYFLGNNKQSKFKRFVFDTSNVPKITGFNSVAMHAETKKIEVEKNTSSSVFLYDQLNLDLEREEIEQPEQTMDALPGILGEELIKNEEKLPF